MPEAGSAAIGGVHAVRAATSMTTRVCILFRGGFRSANRQFLSQLPIRTVKANARAYIRRRDAIVDLVKKQLSAMPNAMNARTDRDKSFYWGKCVDIDRQIDELVYELYGVANKAVQRLEADGGETVPVLAE